MLSNAGRLAGQHATVLNDLLALNGGFQSVTSLQQQTKTQLNSQTTQNKQLHRTTSVRG